jgi:hypothetical protein
LLAAEEGASLALIRFEGITMPPPNNASSNPPAGACTSPATKCPGHPALKDRTRMSIWCFNAPFIKAGTTLDDSVLDKVKAARIDDVSLVYTVAPPASNWGKTTGTAIGWSAGLLGTFPAMRDGYLKNLVAGLQGRGVQVMLGYCIGNSNSNTTQAQRDANNYAKAFAGWLGGLTDQQVKDSCKGGC